MHQLFCRYHNIDDKITALQMCPKLYSKIITLNKLKQEPIL